MKEEGKVGILAFEQVVEKLESFDFQLFLLSLSYILKSRKVRTYFRDIPASISMVFVLP